MHIVRPSREADLGALEAMAHAARPVLHSLPPNRRELEERVALSMDAFRADVEAPGEEFYLFVLEDTATGKLHGTASIVASAGYSAPFYVFRKTTLVHASRELKVNRKVQALTMSHELTGKSRLTGYYIDPALAQGPQAHLLSRARMMFMAQHRHRFADETFAVLLGMTDAQQTSPFWEAVGRCFFNRDFAEIESASGGRSRTFIAELMPSYPLYVPLLPDSAQRVVGEPHPNAVSTYAIHLEEGLEPDRYVDIFDAGPVLSARLSMCRSVRDACVGPAARVAAPPPGSVPHLVANARTEDFRCLLADLPAAGATGDIGLPSAAAARLELSSDDEVRCLALRHEGAVPW
jgi:arginine N-succinyltransferase